MTVKRRRANFNARVGEGAERVSFTIRKAPPETTDLSQSQPGTVASLQHKLDGWKASLPSHPNGDMFSMERLK